MPATPVSAETAHEYREIASAACLFISQNYQDDITLDDFCRDASFSKRTAQRALNYVSLTWRYTLMYTRLETAHDLLSATSMPVSTICHMVGYRSISEFTKAFKKAYGVTPSEHQGTYRRNALRGWPDE